MLYYAALQIGGCYSGSTTSSSPSLTTSEISDYSLEEFADELALIESFPPGNDDMTLEDIIREIKYLLNRDPLYSPNNDHIYTIPEIFTDEHTLDYSSHPRYDDANDDPFDLKTDNDEWGKIFYDDPFDSKENKIKVSKLLVDELDSTGSSSFLPHFLESDSFLCFHKWYQSIALRNFDLEDMELESTNSGPTAKLPILKLGEYEMWAIRIKQYFQIQDYALWEVIENGDSWVLISQTTQENGITVTKMSTPVTAEEKTNKNNNVKARGLLLMELPNEHQLTLSQYPDAKSMFADIETRFGGNAATKKTQKTLLKQQYENFNATSAESLDSIFNRLQKIVSRLAILRVIIAQEDLNLKFLSSLPTEWNTHVVVWINKPEIDTISINDLYNNFKIVEQKIKKTVGTSSGGQNFAFMSAPNSSNTNDVNTASSQVSATSL
ncbi:hypothetical protein Tco_1440332, partial [Tanacetum coccineum]